MKKTKTFILVIFLSAFASLNGAPAFAYFCETTGTVSEGTDIYDFTHLGFMDTGSSWQNNYYARILKSKLGNIVDANGKVLQANVLFDFISESDSRGCDQQTDWVRDDEFNRL